MNILDLFAEHRNGVIATYGDLAIPDHFDAHLVPWTQNGGISAWHIDLAAQRDNGTVMEVRINPVVGDEYMWRARIGDVTVGLPIERRVASAQDIIDALEEWADA